MSQQSYRLKLYALITFLIQFLGYINKRLFPVRDRSVRPDKLCFAVYEYAEEFGKAVHIVCCDCGASHLFWKANDGIYGIPVRPLGYKYRPRLDVGACYATPEERAKKDLGR